MFFVILFVIIIAIAWIRSGISIDFPSFLQPTLRLDRGVFGVYCFTGHQGDGKTYSLNKYIRKHANGKKIYSNITLKNIEYEPIKDLNHLYSLADQKGVIIIYDEIFTLMSKSKKDREMLEEFLPQMRKVKNIFLTTAQYWLELDITFRRFVRIQVECRTRPLGRFGGILTEAYYNTTQIKWSQIDNEYVSPLITKKISKYEKRFMITYDTFERVKKFKNTDVGTRSQRRAVGVSTFK